MKREETAANQLTGIIQEIGEHDFEWLMEQLNALYNLENPTNEYREAVMKEYTGSWEQFSYIWRAYHIYSIAKRMWRKFERIAKKYPNFDNIIKDLQEEHDSAP